MYLHTMIGLLAGGVARRRNERQAIRRSLREMPSGLDTFNDYLLRDIGYVRERTGALHRHILWM